MLRILLALGVSSIVASGMSFAAEDNRPNILPRPNILLVVSDNQSWLHTGIAGARNLNTPGFDRVAREGALFTHAFVPSPSCTPSRSATLTGQDFWRLEEAGVLWGSFPSKFPVYTRLLEEAGYWVGYTGKAWGPGNWRVGGWDRDPAGREWNDIKAEVHSSRGDSDYTANFIAFLDARPEGAPFCFWMGPYEPHRPFKFGAGEEEGKEPGDVDLPAFLPDAPEVRNDFLDYFSEIEWQDGYLVSAMAELERRGELDETLIIVTSDNGMQTPRGITCLYDYGARVPFAVRWGSGMKGGRVIDDFVNLIDLAPTFLELAGVEVPDVMTGRSLVPILKSDAQGQVDPARDFVVTGIERHTLCRPDELPYPSRMIRTRDYLYIRNYEPERWPAGAPDYKAAAQGYYGDVDVGPTKSYMVRNTDTREFELCFGKRPEHELYYVPEDADQVNNLANEPAHQDAMRSLQARMEAYLRRTNDPRVEGVSPWDNYPYYADEIIGREDTITNKAVIPK